MIALVQRVKKASVEVDGAVVASIGVGMLVLVGVEKGDDASKPKAIFDKLRKFRIFPDTAGKMNLNIEQVAGEVLLVPQFTLPAETNKGNRPGFDPVASAALGQILFEQLVTIFKAESNISIQTGVFQADMAVSLINDGPVTFWIRK